MTNAALCSANVEYPSPGDVFPSSAERQDAWLSSSRRAATVFKIQGVATPTTVAFTSMKRAVEERIAALAERQHGVLTMGQLLQAGLTSSGVDRRVRSGRLRRLHRGVFLALPFPLPQTREMAAVLATGPDSHLGHISAGAHWGLCSAAEEAMVDVVAIGSRAQRRGIRLHRVQSLPERDRAVRNGIPVTSPARSLIDAAAELGRSGLEPAVARAEREGLVTPEDLEEVLARGLGRRGAPVLRMVLGTPGGPAFTRSAAEEKFLALVREADLPAPRCNVRVGRWEVDFLWPAGGLAVEVDGYRYHPSHRSFEGDRRKDAELVAAGLTVLRLSWHQIDRQPMVTVARLAPALARCGSTRG